MENTYSRFVPLRKAHDASAGRVCLAVARAKNFTRAAETLHLSQSTLSQHVGELEHQLGVRVFDRLSRAVTLTEAGCVLEEQAACIATTLATMRRSIDELKGLQRGLLVIGASTTLGIYVLPGVVGGAPSSLPSHRRRVTDRELAAHRGAGPGR